MKERNFFKLLEDQWTDKKFVCVGLDTDVRSPKFPQHIKHALEETRMLDFNRRIVDATKDIVCAYKPNSAFYERLGRHGIRALAETIAYINEVAPHVPVILDFKRGDIDNTNEGYVDFAFEYNGADAITVHPYLGPEAMRPFLAQKEKGVFVLCRTSNKGAGEYQDLEVKMTDERFSRLYQGQPADIERFGVPPTLPLYQYVAHTVAARSTGWNANHNCGVVVGATYPEQLAEVRRIVRDMPILIPGIGAQGGDLEATVKAGKDSRNRGMIINSSRGIIFASSGEDFAEAARQETIKLDKAIMACLSQEVASC